MHPNNTGALPNKPITYSVIIPAYNAAKTLGRCLDSLVPQLRDDIEVLLVNDGSTDETEAICRSYQARCPQLRLFSKENGGVSSARNVGLDHAAGSYIRFVDADDAVFDGYFTTTDKALAEHPDFLLFGVQPNRLARKRRAASHIRFCSGEAECSAFISNSFRKQYMNLVTAKLFRKDLIDALGLRFEKDLSVGEDKLFSFRYALHVGSVTQLPELLYQLSVDVPDSLTRKKREKLIDSVLLEHSLFLKALKEAAVSEAAQKRFYRAICYSFYRSGYTVVAELRKFSLTRSQRIARSRALLAQYAAESGYRSGDLRTWILALPIRCRMPRLVNLLISIFCRKEIL